MANTSANLPRDTHQEQAPLQRCIMFQHSSRSSLMLQQLSTIAELITATKKGRFTVQGRANLDTDSGPHSYIACPKCFKKTTAAEHQLYTYHDCGKKQVAKIRAKYNVLIYDNHTQLVVSAFGDVAKTIVGISIQELLSCLFADGSLDIKKSTPCSPPPNFCFKSRKNNPAPLAAQHISTI